METRSEKIESLAKAMIKVQGSIEGAKKVGINPHFRSKYADLGAVWDACRDALQENGLCVFQTGEIIAGKNFLSTILIHESGEWIKSFFPMPDISTNPQAYGSATTYMRRYALSAMIGICPIDDDGEKAMHEMRQPPPKKFSQITSHLTTHLVDDFISNLSKKLGKPREFFEGWWIKQPVEMEQKMNEWLKEQD